MKNPIAIISALAALLCSVNAFGQEAAPPVGGETPPAAEMTAPADRPPAPAPVSTAPAPTGSDKHSVAAGLEIDLAPPIISGLAGSAGFSGQTWIGVAPLKLRLAGSKIRWFDEMIGVDGLRRQETTSIGMFFDYVSGKRFDRYWAGLGFEIWFNQIEHEIKTERKRWNGAVFTVAAGYIWRFYDNFYLNPGLAGHAQMNNQKVYYDDVWYEPQMISGDIALKLGWFFDM